MTYKFPPSFKAVGQDCRDREHLHEGPVATRTPSLWNTEVYYVPSVGKWRALIPFFDHKDFNTPAEAVAWLTEFM